MTDEDDAEGKRLDVRGTPTYFINGRALVGAQRIERFMQLIDEELAKANERIKKGARQATYYTTWVLDKGEKSAP